MNAQIFPRTLIPHLNSKTPISSFSLSFDEISFFVCHSPEKIQSRIEPPALLNTVGNPMRFRNGPVV
jgi:hypothetical protein